MTKCNVSSLCIITWCDVPHLVPGVWCGCMVTTEQCVLLLPSVRMVPTQHHTTTHGELKAWLMARRVAERATGTGYTGKDGSIKSNLES